MLSWLKSIFKTNNCYICKKKTTSPRKYFDSHGKPIVVCHLCTEYAERRAYKKRF